MYCGSIKINKKSIKINLKGFSVCPPTSSSNFDEKIAGQPMKKFLSQIFFQGEAKKGGGQIT
jgi:hypothetical protein